MVVSVIDPNRIIYIMDFFFPFHFVVNCACKVSSIYKTSRPIMALLLDMLAFKATNLDVAFEDFIRWHSTRDWEEDDDLEGSKSLSSNARS